MRSFQERKRIKKIIYSNLIILILVIIIVFLSKSVFVLYKKNKITRDTLRESTRELHSMEERQRLLEKDLERLETGVGMEEVIRSKFNVAKDGEYVVTIIEDESTASSTEVKEEKTFWDRVFFWSN